MGILLDQLLQRGQQQLAADQDDQPLGELRGGDRRGARPRRALRARSRPRGTSGARRRPAHAARRGRRRGSRTAASRRVMPGAPRGAERREQREIVTAVALVGSPRDRETGGCEQISSRAVLPRASTSSRVRDRLPPWRARTRRDRVRGGELVGSLGIALDRLADHVEREELPALELLDRAQLADQRRVVPGHRATRLARRRDQSFAQVELDRRDRDSRSLRAARRSGPVPRGRY